MAKGKAQGKKPTNSKTPSNKPKDQKEGLSRSEWLAISIAGGFTLIAALITVLGPLFIEKYFPQKTSVAFSATPASESISPTQTFEPIATGVIQSPLPQPTLSLPQFAPSHIFLRTGTI